MSSDSQKNGNNIGNSNRDNSNRDKAAGGARFWFWPLVVLAILFFGVAIGIAYNALAPRWSAKPVTVESTPIVIEANAANSDSDTAGTTDTTEIAAGDDPESDNTEADPETSDASEEEATPNTEPTTEPTAEATGADTATEVPTPVPTPVPTETATEMPTETATATSIPTQVLEPTPTWTPEAGAEPVTDSNDCAIAVDGEFLQFYRPALGCPIGSTGLQWAAWQAFQQGYMMWRSDTDAAYALYGQTQGTWFTIPERWDGSATAPRGEPPSTNLLAPERGFGYVWGIREDIFESLGWATDVEKGFCALIQPFDQGFVLQSIPVDSCTADGLFNQARSADWQPITIIASADGRFTIE